MAYKVIISRPHGPAKTQSWQVVYEGERTYRILKSFRFPVDVPSEVQRAREKADKHMEKLKQS